jgi:hypothetical protein
MRKLEELDKEVLVKLVSAMQCMLVSCRRSTGGQTDEDSVCVPETLNLDDLGEFEVEEPLNHLVVIIHRRSKFRVV